MCKPSLFCLIVVFHSGFGLTDSYWIVPFYTLRRQVSLPMRQVEMWLTRHSRKSDGRGSPFSHWGPHFSGKMGTQGPHFYGGPQNFMTPVGWLRGATACRPSPQLSSLAVRIKLGTRPSPQLSLDDSCGEGLGMRLSRVGVREQWIPA